MKTERIPRPERPQTSGASARDASGSAALATTSIRELDRSVLPRWAWLWFPIGFVASIPLARILVPVFHDRCFNRKEGPIEWLTVVTLLVGIGAGLRAWRSRERLPAQWLRGWLLLLILGVTYFALEEVSWGQTVFAWSSPEPFQRLNDQAETNFHNTSSWFDQKPRALLELFVLVGGLVALRLSKRQLGPNDWRAWFWPTRLTVPVALGALTVRLPDRWEKLAGPFEHPVLADLRLSEPQELLFAWFLTLLLCSYAVRLGSLGKAEA
jgi:hypothetical protein